MNAIVRIEEHGIEGNVIHFFSLEVNDAHVAADPDLPTIIDYALAVDKALQAVGVKVDPQWLSAIK